MRERTFWQPKPAHLCTLLIDVIIPAFNEEEAVGHVVRDIPKHLVRNIFVVNNASSDRTAEQARAAGAKVVDEPRRGYGSACLRGMAEVRKQSPPPAVVVFLDADHSDHPEEMHALLQPILESGHDMVIGSRALGKRESGSMTVPQRFGNMLATWMIRFLYGVSFTDLGPFRAVRWDALERMEMQDTTYGWTVEMQLKAAKMNMKVTEVPVDYRKRIGFSKISGTVKGTFMAGYKIIATILKYR